MPRPFDVGQPAKLRKRLQAVILTGEWSTLVLLYHKIMEQQPQVVLSCANKVQVTQLLIPKALGVFTFFF